MALTAERSNFGNNALDFDDLVTALRPPPNRIGKSDGDHEHHLYEGAVMVAFAIHLLRTEGAQHVRVHPDGEHGKQFDFTGWLLRRAFTELDLPVGTASYGGVYRNSTGQTITINPKSGLGGCCRGDWRPDPSRRNAKAGSSTRVIRAKCPGYTNASVRPWACSMGETIARTPDSGRALHGGHFASGRAFGRLAVAR